MGQSWDKACFLILGRTNEKQRHKLRDFYQIQGPQLPFPNFSYLPAVPLTPLSPVSAPSHFPIKGHCQMISKKSLILDFSSLCISKIQSHG